VEKLTGNMRGVPTPKAMSGRMPPLEKMEIPTAGECKTSGLARKEGASKRRTISRVHRVGNGGDWGEV